MQGAAAIGRPLRAPRASDFIWHCTLKERNRSHIPNCFAHMSSNQALVASPSLCLCQTNVTIKLQNMTSL
ncbi:hypothetical protein CRI64_17455 [Escherichia sp. E2748]|nr:hypothetical protein CRI64_17455 [Escherichia sp. E2748]